VDAVIAQQTSPDEAYRKLDNMANKLVDSLRKATRSVQESREARDDKRAKSALLDYENTLEKYTYIYKLLICLEFTFKHYVDLYQSQWPKQKSTGI